MQLPNEARFIGLSAEGGIRPGVDAGFGIDEICSLFFMDYAMSAAFTRLLLLSSDQEPGEESVRLSGRDFLGNFHSHD
jgi:hypothetical protein